MTRTRGALPILALAGCLAFSAPATAFDDVVVSANGRIGPVMATI